MPSSELVPGDVYEVSDPALTQFPCDSILLAGDCIVNESMLTGKTILPKLLPVPNTTQASPFQFPKCPPAMKLSDFWI